MSTIITILIIAIIAALVIVGLKETIKHSKGEGACCGPCQMWSYNQAYREQG